MEPMIMAKPFVSKLDRVIVDPLSVGLMGDEAVMAVGAWNFLLEGGGEEPPNPSIKMPLDDTKGPLENGGDSQIAVEMRAPNGPMFAPGLTQTSEFMIGRAAIGVVLPESSGIGEYWSNTDPSNPGNS